MESARYVRWLEDIHFLSTELPKLHKNLFFSKNEKEFYEDIENLKRDIELYDDYEIMVEIAKIVASVGDAHTSVILPVRLLCPLEFYWFSDGICVVSVEEEYKDILHCKITKINGIEINEVIDILTSIISHENLSFLRSQLPKYIPAIELLYGLEIVDDLDNLIFTYEDNNGNEKTITIKALPVSEAREKLKSAKANSAEKEPPFYRRNPHSLYWFEYINKYNAVYFNYSSCRNMLDKDIDTFIKELAMFLNENKVEKLVIDLRNNFGGDSTLLDPFIQYVSESERINKKGNLFVIVGRDTFSSALLNAFSLKENTEAIFIGEATGGKPNCYGEVQRFFLKNSGFVITYSTEYYKIIEDDDQLSFEPDVYLDLTINDYLNNVDPFLEYVLGGGHK